MREIAEAKNQVTIVGKLLDKNFFEGVMKDGRKYERAKITVRVVQSFDGRTETSDIPVTFFASPYTKAGAPNRLYESIQTLHSVPTVQEAGEAEGGVVRLSSAELRENPYVTKDGRLINAWEIRGSFVDKRSAPEGIACFSMEIFILDMSDEEDSNGEPTGRVIIKGGVVGYGNTLYVMNFVVEDPDKVDYVRRNWEPNITVLVNGRIRVSSQEVTSSVSDDSWGESLPQVSTRTVRELIITGGKPPMEDSFYDPTDIRKMFNERKARIEQLQIDARKSTSKSAPAAAPAATKYSWE